ncbi:hypothetical protein AB0F90_30800, partial [Micromonospora chalcea]|uniref:hypothetical protein n=1 Tax=Micromonospora chalcea TaxID=1874 RepID=UPI0033C8CF8C
VVKNQLIAGGGYPELNPAGAALALLTVGLCVAGPVSASSSHAPSGEATWWVSPAARCSRSA